jgi:4-hydroxy-tetrahydrodipicolinate reductase
MGRAIDGIARSRGHVRTCVVDPEASVAAGERSLERVALDEIEVAFEFTTPASARDNVARLLEAGVAVVCGTTGWTTDDELDGLARRRGVGGVIAPNFSVGMNVFYRLVAEASRRLGAFGRHQPYVWEHHHSGKADAPGGTALRLAQIVEQEDPRHPRAVRGEPEGVLPEGAFHIAALRAGNEPGTHVVGFDGPFDAIELRHRARSREGFASGAVLAAEWIIEVGSVGLHGFDEVVRHFTRSGGTR